MQTYNDPAGGTQSSIEGAGSTQMNTFFWQKKALIEAAKEMFFSPLADVTNMPKHYGKTIKVYHYMPLLDDRNVNDQGLDAAGASYANGNLYGSSKDIGTIDGRLPTLTENGGRVNRVGFTRIQIEGTMQNFGLFHEFSEDSIQFDSDEDLYSHLSREMVTGATQLSEAVLQKELLAGAGVTIWTGDATTNGTVSGESGDPAVATYEDLMALNRILNDNRTPMQTKVITGSRMIDTKTIGAGRVLYIGSELESVVKGMTDLFNDPAFVPVHKYAAAQTTLNGEIGTVDHFRIVVVPEMLHWAAAGAAATGANPGYETSDMGAGEKYNIYPMLVVGGGSFTTIGFQTGGKSMKFKIITKKPGEKTADRNDPYGKMGFSSIAWWHGTMILRPERLAVIKTLAKI